MKIIKVGGTALFDINDLNGFISSLPIINYPATYVISAFGKLSSELSKFAHNSVNYTNLPAPLSVFTDFIPLLNVDQCKIFTHFLENVSININRLALGTNILGEIDLIIIDEILSYGEIVSSFYINCLLNSNNIESIFIDSRNLIKTDSNFGNAKPNLELSIDNIKEQLNTNSVFVTQGFIGSDSNGKTTTMGFESSNLSAMIFARAMNAKNIEIVTKINQIYSFDPEISTDTKPVNTIPYNSAILLAKNSFKLFFPGMIELAKTNNIQIEYKGLSSNSSTIISDNMNFDLPVVMPINNGVLITPITKQKAIETIRLLETEISMFKYDDSSNSLELFTDSIDSNQIHRRVISLF